MDAPASSNSSFEHASQAQFVRVSRRKNPRENTGELAELIVNLMGRTIVCLVHNISEGGAMIESSSYLWSKRVILNYQNKGIRKAARVVWTDGNFAGLEFL